VLGAFLADPAAPRYGYDLMKAPRLPSSTLYPLLARLEHQMLVAAAWETPQQEGQRPRKYYRLTGWACRAGRSCRWRRCLPPPLHRSPTAPRPAPG
jgi:PadR family transcriptional regulator, regulatory protein PadR